MKSLATILSIVLLSVLSSCYTETIVGPQGPRGPQGPTGPAGADGENGFVFEWENINLTAPNYDAVLEYPLDFDVYDSDVALVYLLWDDYTTDDGELVEIWRPLNQTVLTGDGTLMYKYDFSKYDVRVFLEADYPRDMIGALYTDQLVFRVVVVPGAFWNNGRIDFSDYQTVEKALGLPDISKNKERVGDRK